MSDADDSRIISHSPDYDAVVVGASLAGSATAIGLAREGARVALVDKCTDGRAFKRICGHFIQASGVPALERLGLLEPILAAGGIRSRLRVRTPWGWISPPEEGAGYAVNLRRELLDPLVRESAAATPGVELLLGQTAKEVLQEDGVARGVVVEDRGGERMELRGKLLVGADGRHSRVGELAGIETESLPHERFVYGAYYEGASPPDFPNSIVWMMDPQWAAAFPTDSGLTFYTAMPTKDLLADFKQDPEAALVSFLAGLPDPPPIHSGRRVSPMLGKIEMPNEVRAQTAPGLALVGDAALTSDPLYGVGCGWAFQSAEWLAESVAPALQGAESLERGLARYRRRHRRELGGHARLIHDYSTGRRFNLGERLLFKGGIRDDRVAAVFDEFGTRRIRPEQMLPRAVPRAIAANARHALRRRGRVDKAEGDRDSRSAFASGSSSKPA